MNSNMTAEQVRDATSLVPPGCTDVLSRGCVALHKDPIPCRSSTQIRKTGQIPVVMETSSVRVTLPSLWQALPLQRQVKWKTANSHSPPVSHYIGTPLLPHLHYLASISHLLVTAPILGRQTCASISPLAQRKPQCKLGEVVYSAQAASSWGSGVPESFANAVGD